jgi:predicted RNA-binding protein YlqC (UPF0109 family)
MLSKTRETDLPLLRVRLMHWIKETVSLMVDYPQEVKVIQGAPKDGETQLKVIAHPDDIGKIIGKSGRNARSMRVLLLAVSRTTKHTFTLDVVENGGGPKKAPKVAIEQQRDTRKETGATILRTGINDGPENSIIRY